MRLEHDQPSLDDLNRVPNIYEEETINTKAASAARRRPPFTRRGRWHGAPSDARPTDRGRGAAAEARILDAVARLDPTRLALALAVWGASYAAYRFYYAFGGDIGMIGEPRSPAQFRQINLIGGAIILIAAVLPPVAASAWRHKRVRNLVAVAGWIAVVGCLTHAITDEILRLLSLAGVHPTRLSPEFWVSVDRTKADLQDVLLNEPWFFVEGLLAALLALTALPRPARALWLRSAVIACAVASIVGVLSGLDVIPRFHLG